MWAMVNKREREAAFQKHLDAMYPPKR